MIADFSGDFVSFDSTKDGDICIILNEGAVEYNDNLKKEMFNISVELAGKRKTYSPNNKAGQELQRAFGMDTKDWISKKFEILHVQGKMVVRALKSEKVK